MTKRLISILMAICMVLSLLPGIAWAGEPTTESALKGASQFDVTEQTGTVIASGVFGANAEPNLQWRIEADPSGNVLIISGTGLMNEYGTRIGPWNDYGDSIKKIVIEEGVTNIALGIFNECSATSISLPSTMDELDGWWSSTGYWYERNLFGGCEMLQEISVDPRNAAFISVDGVLFTKDMTRLLSYPRGKKSSVYTIPYGVTRIGNFSFTQNDNLSNVIIPDSVIEIGSHAFDMSNGLATLILPDSITSIENDAFSNCINLTNLKLSNSLTQLDSNAFVNCRSLTNVEIPSSVTTIDSTALTGCKNMVSLYIPSSVLFIDNGSFLSGCDSLKDIYYGGDQSQWLAIKAVPNNEFASLAKRTIEDGKCYVISYRSDGSTPDKTAEIHYSSTGLGGQGGAGEDTGTKNISGVLRSGEGWSIRWECSYNEDENGAPHDGKVKISVNDTNTFDELYLYDDSGASEFPWEREPYNIPKSAIASLIVEGTPTKHLRFTANSFQGYTGLTAVTLQSVSGIDSYAFEGCTSLEKVNLLMTDSTLAHIGEGAFKNCTNLTVMTFPDGLTDIGAEAFRNTALEDISIYGAVSIIGENAFFECDNILIWCYEGTAIHQYAQVNNIPFKLIRKQIVDVPLNVSGKTVNMQIQWIPDIMFSNSSSSYNNDLAIAGLILSAAAEGGEGSIMDVMTTMGFSHQEHLGYTQNEISQPALSMGMQKITMKEQEKTLITLVIRGTDTNDGSKDITTDLLSVFDGFSGAGNYAIEKLRGYINSYPSDEIILFITGHSLGAATAGHVASYFSSVLTSEKVFSYTYATPRNRDTTQLKLANVHNIINIRDKVPYIPPNYWARIGTDYPYTTKNNPSFEEAYKKLSGTEADSNPFNLLIRHMPETYMALLLANEPMSVSTGVGYRLVRVLCPVDVDVYDSEGILAGRVEGNIVDKSILNEDVFIFVVDDEKYIYLLEDGAYSFNLTGTAEGVMEYVVQDFTIDGALIAEKKYANVSLEAEKEMISDVGGVINTPNVQLLILDDDGQPELKVLPDNKGTEVPLNVPVITFDTTVDSISVLPMAVSDDGKLSEIPSPARTGYTFNGWYMPDGTKVDTNIVFATDTTVRAQWAKDNTGGNTPSNPNIPNNPDYNPGGTYTPPTHSITTPSVTGGKVSVSPASASSGSTVTVTTTPDTGFALAILTVSDANGKTLELTDKGNGKYSFKMPNGKVTINAKFQPVSGDVPWSNPFTDVAQGAWYYDAVKFVNQNGLMNGVGNGLFAPETHLSRAMLAEILYNKEGRPAMSGGTSAFPDVPLNEWYTDAVSWAYGQGIVKGYDNGLFGSGDDITREQLAVMLYRYAGSPVSPNLQLNFIDAYKVSDWAQDAMRWAVDRGIINGKGNGILDPAGKATRAEAAQMLKNYLEKYPTFRQIQPTPGIQSGTNPFAPTPSLSPWC